MRTVTYTCAECETVKKESNHWAIALSCGNQIAFYKWSDELAEHKQAIHLCGEGCAAKVLSKQIPSWKGI